MKRPDNDIKPTRWGEKNPPHLRRSAGANKCVNCASFSHVPGGGWRSGGMCHLHGEPVHEDMLCADYTPTEG